MKGTQPPYPGPKPPPPPPPPQQRSDLFWRFYLLSDPRIREPFRIVVTGI